LKQQVEELRLKEQGSPGAGETPAVKAEGSVR